MQRASLEVLSHCMRVAIKGRAGLDQKPGAVDRGSITPPVLELRLPLRGTRRLSPLGGRGQGKGSPPSPHGDTHWKPVHGFVVSRRAMGGTPRGWEVAGPQRAPGRDRTPWSTRRPPTCLLASLSPHRRPKIGNIGSRRSRPAPSAVSGYDRVNCRPSSSS